MILTTRSTCLQHTFRVAKDNNRPRYTSIEIMCANGNGNRTSFASNRKRYYLYSMDIGSKKVLTSNSLTNGKCNLGWVNRKTLRVPATVKEP